MANLGKDPGPGSDIVGMGGSPKILVIVGHKASGKTAVKDKLDYLVHEGGIDIPLKHVPPYRTRPALRAGDQLDASYITPERLDELVNGGQALRYINRGLPCGINWAEITNCIGQQKLPYITTNLEGLTSLLNAVPFRDMILSVMLHCSEEVAIQRLAERLANPSNANDALLLDSIRGDIQRLPSEMQLYREKGLVRHTISTNPLPGTDKKSSIDYVASRILEILTLELDPSNQELKPWEARAKYIDSMVKRLAGTDLSGLGISPGPQGYVPRTMEADTPLGLNGILLKNVSLNYGVVSLVLGVSSTLPEEKWAEERSKMLDSAKSRLNAPYLINPGNEGSSYASSRGQISSNVLLDWLLTKSMYDPMVLSSRESPPHTLAVYSCRTKSPRISLI